MNEQLIEYIRASREQGVKEYFIRQVLIDAGWKREIIDKAMDSPDGWPRKGRVDFNSSVIKKGGLDIKDKLRRIEHPVLWIVVSVLLIAFVVLTLWAIDRYKRDFDIVIPGPDGNISLDYGSWPELEDAQFFERIKSQFIAQGASFIESDLSEMTLRVYKDGSLAEEVPILSKGREGSWWETPAGLYKIEGKESNHFSSFGQVNMPWSMPFQGNFFIHGWPHYTNGEPVPEGYSGGCIRLSNEDAKSIYDLASVGMPVLVHEADFSGDDFQYKLLGDKLGSDHYLAADLANNFVFTQKQVDEVVPIASIAKLMTAVVATEYINIEKEITVTSNMLTQTSKPRLYAGQRISVFNLLFPLLMESSNEAGTAIAAILGEGRFVDLMNNKAKAIGMEDTKFVDPNGIGAGNVSSAADLFQLAKYLYYNRSFVLDMSRGGAQQSVYGPHIWNDLQNFNVFAQDSEFVGGKVGMTNAAKETILSIFEIPNGDATRPVVVISLGTDNRARDAQALIEYVRNSY